MSSRRHVSGRHGGHHSYSSNANRGGGQQHHQNQQQQPNQQQHGNQGNRGGSRVKSAGTTSGVHLTNLNPSWARKNLFGFLKSLVPNLIVHSTDYANGAREANIEVDTSIANRLIQAANRNQQVGVRASLLRRGGGGGNELEQALYPHVASHYDPQSKFLSLASFHSYFPQANFNNGNFCSALFNIIANNCPDVATIDLSGNNISDLTQFKQLPVVASEVRALSLANNNIQNIAHLSALRGYRDSLDSLNLLNNPCVAAQDSRILSHLLSQTFSVLSQLNNEPFVPLLQFNLPANLVKTAQLPAPAGSCVHPSLTDAVPDFARRFFVALDQRRPDLLSFYVPDATCTVSLGRDANTVPSNQLTPYMTVARNLAAAPPTDPSNMGNVARGHSDIGNLIQRLPETFHDVDELTYDALTIPGSTVITLRVSGSFLDVRYRLVRDFFRSFVIMATTDAAGALTGMHIVNDALFVVSRATPYTQEGVPSHAPAVAVGASFGAPGFGWGQQGMPGGAAAPFGGHGVGPQHGAGAAAAAYAAGQLTEQQMLTVVEVARQAQCEETRAFEALNAAQWNPNGAMQLLQQARG